VFRTIAHGDGQGKHRGRSELASAANDNGASDDLTHDIYGRPRTATNRPGSARSLYQFSYNAVSDLA
jgi:hypothetical protein